MACDVWMSSAIPAGDLDSNSSGTELEPIESSRGAGDVLRIESPSSMVESRLESTKRAYVTAPASEASAPAGIAVRHEAFIY